MTSSTGPNPDSERYASRIGKLVERFGEVPPPWACYPRVHPYDIHWRMGGGEDYCCLFSTWASSRAWSPEDRIAYVRRWHPPFSWLEWVAWFLWPEDAPEDGGEPSDDHFAKMEASGLGSRADLSRCFDVEPDSYPLPEDVSSGWLEPVVLRELLDP
jgi:hypothetical protein